MSFTVFLGNLPVWVTADDIQSWLTSDGLVADAVKVIRNPETQESKGFAFIEAPNQEEMQSIIRRYDGAPLEDRKLRANPAQPPKGKGAPRTNPPGQYSRGPQSPGTYVPPSQAAATTTTTQAAGPSAGAAAGPNASATTASAFAERSKRGGRKHKKGKGSMPQSAFAEELAKAL